MISKNNISITTRRKFLKMFVGTTIGFSLPFIKNTNSVIAQQIIWNYLFSVVLPTSSLTLLAYVGHLKLLGYVGGSSNKSNKQSKLSEANFKFRIDNPPLGTNINFDIYIVDGNRNRLGGRRVRKTISPNETKYWIYRYTWKGNGYDPPLYLVIASGGNSAGERFY